MSKHDCNIVRGLKLHEIQNSEHNKRLVRQYALYHCTGFIRQSLQKIAA